MEAIVVGLPKRLDGSDTEQTLHVRRMVDRLRAVIAAPIVLQDERLSSHEADSRLALTERDWRKRKARLDAASAAVILQDYLDSRTRPHAVTRCHRGLMRRLIFVILAVLVAIAAAAGVVYSRVDRPFKGYEAAEQFVEVPPGAGSSRQSAGGSSRAGVVRDALDVAHRGVQERARPGCSRRASTASRASCGRPTSSPSSRAATSTCGR